MQPLADLVRKKSAKTVAKTVSHALQHADVPFTIGRDACFGMVLYPGAELNYVVGGDEYTWSKRPRRPCLPGTAWLDATQRSPPLRCSRVGTSGRRADILAGSPATPWWMTLEWSTRCTPFRSYVQDRGQVPSSLAIDNVLRLGNGLGAFLLDGGDSLSSSAQEGGGGGGGGSKGGGDAPVKKKKKRTKPPNMPMEIWIQKEAKHRQQEKDALAAKQRALAEIKQRRDTIEGLLKLKASEVEKAQREAHAARHQQFAQEADQMRANLALLRAQVETAEQERDRQEAVIVEGDVRCPITCEVMKDPVTMIMSGMTYEREPITEWIAAGNLTDPCTRMPIGDAPYFVENVALRGLCRKYAEANPDM